MATHPEAKVAEFLDQAAEAVGAAMKAGARFQEDLANFWVSALGQADTVQQWQARARAVIGEAMPALRRNADEYVRVWGQVSRSGIEMMKKMFESSHYDSPADAHARAQDLWEGAIAAVRANAQAMAQANVRAMESWADVMRATIGDSVAAAARGVEETIGKASRAQRESAGAR